MFAEAISEIARERASLLRDVEYIRESVKDADLQESFLILEACGMNGLCREEDIVSKEEHRDLCNAIMQIPDDCSDEREEIDRIVNCEKPSMTIDDIMGISPDSISEGCGGSYKEACGKKDYSEACGGMKCEYCEACSKYEYCEACGGKSVNEACGSKRGYNEACGSKSVTEACGKKDYSEACGGMKCEYCEACSKYEYCEACGDKRNCN